MDTEPKIHRKFRIRPLRPDEKGYLIWKDIMEEYWVNDEGVEVPAPKEPWPYKLKPGSSKSTD